ncbi:hypothetical protein [Marinobacter phage PS6]|nr:hypothetical protein [Marinobacter phage PS6]
MKTQKGKILELIREKNSTNGNPRFTAVIQDCRGFVTMATTAPDSSLSYSMKNYDGKWIEYQTAMKRGKLTLVSVERAEISKQGEYIDGEFSSLPDSPIYKMQVTACDKDGNAGKTKWLNITGFQMERIREILVNG